MLELIVSLLPLALAAALQPPQVIALVILMQTQRGVANGWAYLTGMAAFRLVLGGVSYVLISNVEEAVETKGGRFDIFVGAVLVVLGLLLLINALRRGLSTRDEDEPAASWLSKLDHVSPPQAALVGLTFLALDSRDWLIDISAVDLIAAADRSGWQSLLAYLAYALLTLSLLLIPLILAVVNAQKAREHLGRIRAWLERHERMVTIPVAVLLGCFFLYAGLDRLGTWS